MKGLRERFEDFFTALAFAEAGELDWARFIILGGTA